MSVFVETPAVVLVHEAEYLRLLGFPPGHQPDDRVHELMRWARSWYATHGHPWMHWREVRLELRPDGLELDGRAFGSAALRDHLRAGGATRAALLAVSAGTTAEDEAQRRWEAGRPDEYFFLETYASAVVEQLVAAANGRICDTAARADLMALPHLSPGYTGWDIGEQGALHGMITGGGSRVLPGPLEVLSSGMLRPKKSLLAVVGLAPRTEAALRAARVLPCERCACSPCNYRRTAYRQAPARIEGLPAARPAANAYTINPRALRKWAEERTRFELREDGSTLAQFRFDGTTCSNMGRPLAFEYRVRLSPPARGSIILEAECRPVAGDTGHQAMCAYQADAAALMRAIAGEKPLVGRPLDAVLQWPRESAPAGCLCEARSRAHKWGLALEVIHFALAQRVQATPALPLITHRS